MVRPPGGGTGGVTPGDARPAAIDAGSDGGAEVAGLICIVTDLRQPDACPVTSAQIGVNVRTGTAVTAVSDQNGRFTLPATATSLELDVADGASNLVPSRLRATTASGLLHAPVVTAAHWAALLSATDARPSDGAGMIVVYIDDAGGRATGVVFDAVPGTTIAPLYDAGGALAWTHNGGTGIAGVALLLDVVPDTYTLVGTAADRRLVSLTGVSVGANRITFVRGRLPP